MKKLILTVAQINLLCKVSDAGHHFYDEVDELLEESRNLPEGESITMKLNIDHYSDVIEMMIDYLEDDSLLNSDKPTEEEIIQLQELIIKLKSEL